MEAVIANPALIAQAQNNRNSKFQTFRDAAVNQIALSHVTVRQSISILLLKLILLEIISAVIFITLRQVLFSSEITFVLPFIGTRHDLIFFLAVFLKIFLMTYLILLWINEYYVITPTLVRHKSGIIFIKKEQLGLADIQSVTIHQGFPGKILNYGTLAVYDWKWERYEYLYAIHNPEKYLRIVEQLLPGIDQEKTIIRERVMEEED